MARKYKMRSIVESFEEEKPSRRGDRTIVWPREKLNCGHIIQPPIEYRDHIEGPQPTSGHTFGGAVEVAPTRRRCYQCGRESA